MGTTSDKWPSQDLSDEEDERGEFSDPRDDLSNTKLYELQTKELPIKWMLISPLPQVKQMCQTGTHMPSIVSLITTVAEHKICEKSKNIYIPGNCSNTRYNNDQTSCIVNEDPELNGINGVPTKTENGRTFATGVYSKAKCCSPETYTEGYCMRNGEFLDEADAINITNCELKYGGEWTPDVCDEGHLGNIQVDDATKRFLDMISQTNSNNDYNPFLNVSDIAPKDYGVNFNEDTGICNYTSAYCTRFGRSHESIPHRSLAPNQRLTRCYNPILTQGAIELFGEEYTRDTIRFFSNVADGMEEIATEFEHDIDDTVDNIDEFIDDAEATFVNWFDKITDEADSTFTKVFDSVTDTIGSFFD